MNTVVQRADSAAERTESVATQRVSNIKSVCRVACLVAFIMPIVTLGVTVWTLSNLRGQQLRLEQRNVELAAAVMTAAQMEKGLAEEIARQKNEIQMLSSTAEVLKNETGGLDLMNNGDGSWEIAFPVRAEFERRPWWNLAGRHVAPFSISGK